ncbi:BLOC-1-related complex subunit 5-like [Trichoplusia ni]|uniref:BLOC-1-related complex subunit 5 n=1 Tax=Trichoplusia ni TaxID=7111 RepID=A0A7E5WGK6_TRINI|nr:BLOC-1-related complex subunit 5-like [Trichoplusia ni]XP_026739782.1 BLOC-1-related complex subunit 5-like [Trichoplusia ni]XP_026739829.1 BLOC-1-related complex subunit 5-like [Trichoplusia ni]XP_026739830.1 BLOC-1-related complex subunit 5-like [Trichoplusia ni]
MGSEQSSVPPKKQTQRAPPVRRGHTIAVTNIPEPSRVGEPTVSGNNSPGTSVCSDSELPYISYTVDRPIGDSPKASAKNQRGTDSKKSLLQRRQLSLQARKSKRTRDIVVVKQPTDEQLDEDIQRLQEIPTFLPIMRGTLGLPGARDPEVLEGLDYRPWVRLTTRLQAHLAACAHPLAADEISIAMKIKEADLEVSRLHAAMVERQRANARHAERLARAHDVSHQLTRCYSLLQQTLLDAEELNALLPEDKRLEPFVWNTE